MVSVTELWLPILVSAVFVFIASSLIHMVLGYHKGDYGLVPDEGSVSDALRRFNIPPGDYCMPRASSMADMKNPAFMEKIKKGPVLLMTVMPNGQWSMGSQLTQWFLFSALVSVFAAYIAGRAVAPGDTYLDVFRFAGCTAFVSYAMGAIPTSIWYKKSWATTMKIVFDGLIYGLLTGGTFGWLWPKL